jgi:hypothetical protein
MKIRLLSCLLLMGACGLAQAADCTYPRQPTKVPDGNTATQQEMVASMAEVKEYNAQVTAYLACLDEKMNADIANAGPEAAAEVVAQIKAINAKRHNAAIEALESHAARFNQEVRTFKSRDKDKAKS